MALQRKPAALVAISSPFTAPHRLLSRPLQLRGPAKTCISADVPHRILLKGTAFSNSPQPPTVQRLRQLQAPQSRLPSHSLLHCQGLPERMLPAQVSLGALQLLMLRPLSRTQRWSPARGGEG